MEIESVDSGFIYTYSPSNGRFFIRSKFWGPQKISARSEQFLIQLNAPFPTFHTEASQVSGEI